MAGPANNPEKSGKEEKLKKIPKRPARWSKKKCLACNNGRILFHGVEYDCSACRGTGFII